MLALGQPRELERGDRSRQTQLVGQTTVPGARHLALLAVIGLLRARELTGVVALRLTRAERFRDRQHSGLLEDVDRGRHVSIGLWRRAGCRWWAGGPGLQRRHRPRERRPMHWLSGHGR